MSTLVRKVVRDLVRRRVRTALTLTGIVVGVAGLVAVSAAARQLGVAQRSLVRSGDHPDLTVQTTPLAAQTASLASTYARSRGGTTTAAGQRRRASPTPIAVRTPKALAS